MRKYFAIKVPLIHVVKKKLTADHSKKQNWNTESFLHFSLIETFSFGLFLMGTYFSF